MIELLNMSAVWSKVKAGMKGGDLFRSPATKGSYRYVDGIKPEVAAAQQRPAKIASAFTGKMFKNR